LGQLFDHGLDSIIITFGLLFLIKGLGLTYIVSALLLVTHNAAKAWKTELLPLSILASGAVAALLVQNLILYDMADLPADRYFMISAVHLTGSILYVFLSLTPFGSQYGEYIFVLICLGCVLMEICWVFVMFSKLADTFLNINIFSRH
jgi:hypothetical protein